MITRSVLCFLLFATTVGAFAQLRLLRDINPGGSQGVNPGSNPSSYQSVDDVVYFLATDAIHKRGLWRTDGTAEGTQLVKGNQVGNGGISGSLIKAGRILYFEGLGQSQRAVWRSDGTNAGTYIIKQDVVEIGEIAAVGNSVFFTTYNPASWELWKSNGTQAGTSLVMSFNYSYLKPPAKLTSANGKLFFMAADEIAGEELWVSDGTVAGTKMVADHTPGNDSSIISQLFGTENTLYFVLSDPVLGIGLGKSTGTNISFVKSFSSPHNASINILYTHENEAFFNVNDGINHGSFWKSDGTETGTKQIISNHPEANFTEALDFTVCRDTVFFTARNNAPEVYIWKINTGKNTATLVRDIGGQMSLKYGLTTLNNSLYYLTTGDFASSSNLIKDLGIYNTPITSVAVLESNQSFETFQIFTTSTKLFFGATVYATGNELWVSDGKSNSAETQMLKDIHKLVADSEPKNFTPLNDNLYFTAGDHLWVTRGTSETTASVNTVSSPHSLFAFNDKLIYSDYRGEVWCTQGTLTTSIKSNGGSYGYCVYNNYVYFFSKVPPPSNNGLTIQLWKTDGTPLGTTFIKTIDTQITETTDIKALNNYLYFGNHSKLWKSDGTESGTNPVYSFSGVPIEFCTAGNKLFIIVSSGLGNYQLMVSDGTTQGTVSVKSLAYNLNPVGSECYFMSGEQGGELWKSDGTITGTVPILESNSPNHITYEDGITLNSKFIFSGGDSEYNPELWITDGTKAGTTLLKDIMPNLENPFWTTNNGSYINDFSNTGETIMFRADDGQNGNQLWETNGTPEGTKKLTSEVNAVIQHFFYHNGISYIVAKHPDYGQELFVYDPSLVLSIDESKGSINVYPNPSKDFIHIKINEKSTITSFSIYSAAGMPVPTEFEKNDTEIIIDVRQLPIGVYVVIVQQGKKIMSKKVLVSR